MLNNRSVLEPPPVYWSVVPALSTTLEATLLDWPRLLAEPPLARELTLRTPALTVTVPVNVLALANVNVPAPDFVSDEPLEPITPLTVVLPAPVKASVMALVGVMAPNVSNV